MSTQSERSYDSILQLINDGIQECTFKITQTEENLQRRGSLQRNIDLQTVLLNNVESCIIELKPFIDDIENFIARKKETSMTRLKSTLHLASEIIDSALPDIYLNIDGDEAMFDTMDGLDLDLVEGSGYRSLASVFIRLQILKSNPEILQDCILDEPFAKVSPEKTATLSSYLPIIAQGVHVVSIEQKKETYANIECQQFSFTKVGAETVVKEEA